MTVGATQFFSDETIARPAVCVIMDGYLSAARDR